MASIAHLAPEVILIISSYLSVTEAVLFLSCCHYLYSITKNRHFWLTRVQCMWSRYDIPRSTSDLSTASTLELRRIVARPFRFQRAIIKKNLSRRSPIKLQNHTTELRWIETNCVEAILIPGGRWLVILSEGRVNSSYDDEQPMSAVTVYDIRMPAEKCFTVVAHSRLHGEQACYSGITVSPDPVGPGPMVFAEISHRGSAGKYSLVAYRLNPLRPHTCALEPIASLDMLDEPTYTGSLCVTGNLLAHIHIQDSEQKLFIWDWVNGRYGVYQGDRNIIALDPILVAIYEDGALFVDRAQPNKMIKLSWPDSPIKEHLKPTSDPLVVDTPTISVEEEFFVSDPQDTLSDSGPHHMVRCSTDWSTIVQPPSLLISDGSQERTLLINIVPKSLGFVTRTHPISFVDGGDRPVFQGKTISGHVAVCDEKGGVTTLLSGGGRSTYQVLERDINRQDTPTPIPFMCPISGTFGYMGDSGEIFIWQQK